MEACESHSEQGLSCELVEDESQSGKSQSLIRLHLLSWVFELDVAKLYATDGFFSCGGRW